MHTDDLRQLSAWLAATDIALLDLRGPGVHLRLRNDGAGAEVVAETAAMPIVARAASVGIFLHRHPLHETPLAPPGLGVLAGQTIGLLQIGSLLLPVHAPRDGTLRATLVAHGTAVGYGTPLVELDPLDEAG